MLVQAENGPKVKGLGGEMFKQSFVNKHFVPSDPWGQAVHFIYLFIIYLAVPNLCCSMWDLVPWPGIRLQFPALRAQNLSHWTTREVPPMVHFNHLYSKDGKVEGLVLVTNKQEGHQWVRGRRVVLCRPQKGRQIPLSLSVFQAHRTQIKLNLVTPDPRAVAP